MKLLDGKNIYVYGGFSMTGMTGYSTAKCESSRPSTPSAEALLEVRVQKVEIQRPPAATWPRWPRWPWHWAENTFRCRIRRLQEVQWLGDIYIYLYIYIYIIIYIYNILHMYVYIYIPIYILFTYIHMYICWGMRIKVRFLPNKNTHRSPQRPFIDVWVFQPWSTDDLDLWMRRLDWL